MHRRFRRKISEKLGAEGLKSSRIVQKDYWQPFAGKRQETSQPMRRSTSTMYTCPSPTKEKMTSKRRLLFSFTLQAHVKQASALWSYWAWSKKSSTSTRPVRLHFVPASNLLIKLCLIRSSSWNSSNAGLRRVVSRSGMASNTSILSTTKTKKSNSRLLDFRNSRAHTCTLYHRQASNFQGFLNCWECLAFLASYWS